MYAIIETGGRQYTVSSGDTLQVDFISSGAANITLDKVLAVIDGQNTVFGTPYISGAAVKADILGSGKAEKVLVYKKRPRRVYEKLRGHRQPYTTLKITEIRSGG